VRREYPVAPIVAVGVIVLRDGRIALIRRDREPAKGLWTFPGGAVELGETVREAAQREAREETGLEVEIGEVAAVVDNVIRDASGAIQYHYVILDFYARPTGGVLRAGTDVSDARWASLADVETLEMTEKAREIALQLLADPASGPWL
jgi:8-oxo-dGTP diphosphatase